ncbi:Uncharacterized protein Rs2_09582 [Raphanus sativus]|nr:Uncharacterized protein Rs2_09582 [Raphanus sativus]
MFLPFPFYNSRPNFYNPDGKRQNETTEIGFHGREKSGGHRRWLRRRLGVSKQEKRETRAMIPPKKARRRCDDPEALFSISALLERLGGDDEVTLLDFVGEKLPQHTGLVLTDVLDADHDPKVSSCTRVRSLGKCPRGRV